MVRSEFKIAGQNLGAPVEWPDITIFASFERDTEGDLEFSLGSLTELTWVNEAAQFIRNYIQDGLSGGVGIFEAIPIEITVKDGNNAVVVFDGSIDLTTFNQESPVKITAAIDDINSINSFRNRTRANTYGYLFEGLQNPVITTSDFIDVEYVVERKIQPLELALLGVSIFLMAKELAEAVFRLAKRIADAIAHTTGGATGGIAGPIFTIAVILIEAVYVATLIVALIDLIETFINQLVSPIRTHKGIELKRLLQKPANYFGYDFETGISFLNDTTTKLVYIPSKPDEEEALSTAIPNPEDPEYFVDEMYNIARRLFNARVRIIDGTVQFRSENDPFWTKNATYVLPDTIVEKETARYNTFDLKGNILLNFLTDASDLWTTNNYDGTSYGVTTEPITVNDEKLVKIKNFDRVDFGVALGNRKDELNDVERGLQSLAGLADGVINFFGGNSNLVGKIRRRLGMLKVSDNVHEAPKLVLLRDGKLPTKHRDLWNAQILWDEFHNEKSFVDNDFGKQELVYEGVKIPFGFSNFIELINNNFFTTGDGREGEITNIEWNFDRDFAIVSFRIKEVYTKNLVERKIRPTNR